MDQNDTTNTCPAVADSETCPRVQAIKSPDQPGMMVWEYLHNNRLTESRKFYLW